MASYLKLITKFVKCFYISNYIVFYLTYNKLFCVRNFCFKTGYLSPEILALLRKKKEAFPYFFRTVCSKNITIPYFRFPDEVLSLYFRENKSVIVFEKDISENIWRQTRKAISSLLLNVPLVRYINNF